MSDEFDSLDVTKKAGIIATLRRCRVLAAKIANELRSKESEHFVVREVCPVIRLPVRDQGSNADERVVVCFGNLSPIASRTSTSALGVIG
jgi:hypothetical protein